MNRKIAEQEDAKASATAEHARRAEREFREYGRYQADRERNDETVKIELTLGECKLLIGAIDEYERALMRSTLAANSTALLDVLPYEAQLLPDLYERLQMIAYGRVFRQGAIIKEHLPN